MVKEFKMDKNTEKIISNFQKIAAIPRRSGNEEGIRRYLVAWANERNLENKVDKVGNVIIYVPATKGYENRPTIALQGHMDMVCEKTPDSKHDFTKDPIEFVYDGEWLKANKTTLGADNGIALAMALTMVEDKKIKHPALELVFTVSEETALVGASGIEENELKSKYLLNIDSENDKEFTIGCAGGQDTDIAMELEYSEVPDNYIPIMVKVSGCQGGHSGSDISMERANAIKLLSRSLLHIMKICDARIVSLSGGTAHNAIPRDAEAVIWIPENSISYVRQRIALTNSRIRNEYKQTDCSTEITVSDMQEMADRRAMTSEISLRAIDLIRVLPHGVAAWPSADSMLVETSSNLAIVKIEEGQLLIKTNVRSSVMSRRDGLSERIHSCARLAGAHAVTANGYVAWEPKFDSILVAKCKEIYKKVTKEEPIISVIHAGLECGLIGEKHPNMEMISMGPTIENCHSPREQLNLPSVEKMYKVISKILEELE